MFFPLTKAIWRVQKWRDRRRYATPSDDDAAKLAAYYTKAMDVFRALNIDIDSKPGDQQRLYHMILMYLDHDETICPASARTATLIGFLDSLKDGWVLPPTSTPVSTEFAKEVDGYVAVEVFRNHLGMKDIHDEICAAIGAFGGSAVPDAGK